MFLAVVASATLLLGLSGGVEAQPLPDDSRGYVSRACGFDMDGDGIVGERDDDCRVCDGSTADPDGDGVREDLIYVDCNSGNDSGAGTPSNPYRTIRKALSVADGPGDGAEDIICARATCSPANGSVVADVDIRVSGVGTSSNWYHTRPRRGPEERDFKFPANPVMIVGWDTDQDGAYPPYDSDQPEPLVLDACSVSDCSSGTRTARGFMFSSDTDYIEIAHFTMKNYARNTTTNPAANFYLPGTGRKVGIYLHDIVSEYFSFRSQAGGNRASIYTMMGWNGLDHFAVENYKSSYFTSWPMRGNINGEYMRLRNLEVFGDRPISGNASQPGLKLWSVRYAEYIGMKFDSDSANIGSGYVIPQLTALQLSKSHRDVVVRQNLFKNYHQGLIVDYRDCDSSTQTNCPTMAGQVTADNIVIERNLFVREAQLSGGDYWQLLSYAVAADGQERGGDTKLSDPNCEDPRGVGLTNLTIRNNVFRSSVSRVGAIALKIGSNCSGTPLGPVYIDNNTFIQSAGPMPAQIRIGTLTSSYGNYDYRYYADTWRIRNNMFAGVRGAPAILVNNKGFDGYTGLSGAYPKDFVASDNSYGGSPSFVRGETTYTSLGSWQSLGYDARSTTCDTTFASDRYHLSSSDTCSRNRGANASCPIDDFDGRARARNSSDVCDRGADEEGNGSAPDPDPEPGPAPAPSLQAPVLREASPLP